MATPLELAGSRNRIRLTDPLQNHRIYIGLSNLRTQLTKLTAVGNWRYAFIGDE